jgi:hypothetical protein
MTRAELEEKLFKLKVVCFMAGELQREGSTVKSLARRKEAAEIEKKILAAFEAQSKGGE